MHPERNDAAVPVDEDRHVARALVWRYAVALLLVARLSSAAWLSLRWVIQEQESTAALVNVSGRQRMLSQRIAMLSLRLVGADEDLLSALQSELEQAVALMQRPHQGLLNGDASTGLPARMSEAVRALYYGPEGDLDAQVRAYLEVVTRWLQLPAPQRTSGHPLLQRMTEQASGPLLAALDGMVTRYQREGEARVAWLQRAETLFWLLTLLLLSLEAALIFHPFVRHMRRVMGQLQASRAALRAQQNELATLVQERTQELQDSEQKFRQIATSARDGRVIFDADDRLV
ncbi:MAG: hypothetical protein OHK0048_17300 [Rhodoferax sp.]